MKQRLLTAHEAAAELGITPQRVYVLIKSGRLKAVKFGHVWMIERGALRPVRHRKWGRPKKKKWRRKG